MAAILITAGPTREYLDDVRFLSNASSGRMGCALGEAAVAMGHRVTLVLGPVEVAPPDGCVVVRVVSALEMQAAAERAWPSADIAIAAAAVADWRPRERRPGKPARQPGAITVDFVANPDIVAGLAADKGGRVVVGFALESAAAGMAAAIARGRAKLQRKQLDLVVVNLHDVIGGDATELVLCATDGAQRVVPPCQKRQAARQIVEAAVELWQARSPAKDSK